MRVLLLVALVGLGSCNPASNRARLKNSLATLKALVGYSYTSTITPVIDAELLSELSRATPDSLERATIAAGCVFVADDQRTLLVRWIGEEPKADAVEFAGTSYREVFPISKADQEENTKMSSKYVHYYALIVAEKDGALWKHLQSLDAKSEPRVRLFQGGQPISDTKDVHIFVGTANGERQLR
jgi:hypothetical protein